MTPTELDAARAALAADLTIDIVTTGRRSGEPRTTEIWFTRADGSIYICGPPAAVKLTSKDISPGSRSYSMTQAPSAQAVSSPEAPMVSPSLFNVVRLAVRGQILEVGGQDARDTAVGEGRRAGQIEAALGRAPQRVVLAGGLEVLLH